ncbi:DUF4391 domain-containing protein [Caproiciproducens faecalis]|uniref:DUF4391 domain-containing protein n=1 Tax=Caproiciproducens faecalis TaxID=2820301 RepID=A0ABS7DN42_9FIRM|nr:DUF4391 domain-containing protein [Caproiciproducens faecalis]
MLNLPKSTYFERKIPKEKFYKNLDIDSKLRQRFISGIDSIVWQNKLSKTTLNVADGANVIEIDVLEVILKGNECDYKLLEFIDSNIPHHTVFILRMQEKAQLVINFKEAIKNREGKFKISATYKTDWSDMNALTLSVNGLDMDKIYENFILQIASGKLNVTNSSDLKEAIAKAKEIDDLKAQIAVLEAKIAREKQFNVQVKLNAELKKLKEKLLQNS